MLQQVREKILCFMRHKSFLSDITSQQPRLNKTAKGKHKQLFHLLCTDILKTSSLLKRVDTGLSSPSSF